MEKVDKQSRQKPLQQDAAAEDPVVGPMTSRPWEAGTARPDVPWEMRTYGLSMRTGNIRVLAEEFSVAKVGENKGKLLPVKDTLDNNSNDPVMDFEQASKLFDHCEENKECLTLGYVRLFGKRKLTIEQIENLADVPQVYVAPRISTAKKKMAEAKASARKKMIEAADLSEIVDGDAFGGPVGEDAARAVAMAGSSRSTQAKLGG